MIDGNAFAGEGLIEPLKPGERRLLSYAADRRRARGREAGEPHPAGCCASALATASSFRRPKSGRAGPTRRAAKKTTPVTLIVEHRQRPGWKLASGQTPAESTPDAHRFRVVVEPRKEATLVVREVRAGDTRVAVGDFMRCARRAARDGRRRPRRRCSARWRRCSPSAPSLPAIERQLAALKLQQRRPSSQDQQRLRENMKALRGSAEEKQLLQRYTRQLDEQENKLEALRQRDRPTTKRQREARSRS